MRIKRRTKLPNLFFVALYFYLLGTVSIIFAVASNWWNSLFLLLGLSFICFICGSALVFLGIKATVTKIPLKPYDISFIGGIFLFLMCIMSSLAILESRTPIEMLILTIGAFLIGCYSLYHGWLELNEKYRD